MTAQAKVEKYKRDFSNPNLYNSVYIPLFKNNLEFIHLFGSAGSGKSRFIAQKEIVKSYLTTRFRRKTMQIRKVAETLKNSVYDELKTVIYDWKLENDFTILKSPLLITNKLTGVEFLFNGLDDVMKLKSISGVDRMWVEEATELNEKKELDQLRLRMRGFDKVQITLSYNPIDEYHWLNTEIHQTGAEEHFLFHSTYKDNIQMLRRDPKYALYIESLETSNPNYFRVYGQGLWGRVLEGLIYESFEIIPEFPQTDKKEDDIHFYGLDFGFTAPTALVAQHVQDAAPKKNLIQKEILYESGLDAEGLVSRFNSLNVRKDVKIIADAARPEMISALQKAGYKCLPCEKFAGSVLSGINRVRAYNIQIVAGSKNGIKEIQNYQKKQLSNGQWLEEPAPNQVDHFWDAVRYGEQAANIPQWSITPRPSR